jgi:hypothetical protein
MRFPKRLALIVAAVVATVGAAASARAATAFICTPAGVGVFASKAVSLRCTTGAPPGNSIFYFAFSLKKKEAPLMLQLFMAAKAEGKLLAIFYEPDDLSGQKIGCSPSECRLLLAAEIQS